MGCHPQTPRRRQPWGAYPAGRLLLWRGGTNIFAALLNRRPSSGHKPSSVARGRIKGDVGPNLASCAQRRPDSASHGFLHLLKSPADRPCFPSYSDSQTSVAALHPAFACSPFSWLLALVKFARRRLIYPRRLSFRMPESVIRFVSSAVHQAAAIAQITGASRLNLPRAEQIPGHFDVRLPPPIPQKFLRRGARLSIQSHGTDCRKVRISLQLQAPSAPTGA
jgi:hypothetical protein